MNEFLNSLNGSAWVLSVFFIVLATLVINFIALRIYKGMLPKLEATKHLWDDAFARAIFKPLSYLIWVIGLSFAFKLIAFKVQETIQVAPKAELTNLASYFFDLESIVRLRNLAIIGLFVWGLIRFISEFEAAMLDTTKRKKVDKATVNAVAQLVRLAVIITAVLIGLQTLNIQISGFLAVGGVGTLAVGFAAKDWLSNFFGGLVIYLDRPFAVGDWVRSPDKNIEGTVEKIGWRSTRIRTFDKRPLYVPNGIFSSISIENPSRMRNRRIKTLVGVRYDDAMKIKQIISDVKSMLQNHPEIDTTQTLIVNLVEFGSSSLNFMVYTFTKTTNWVQFQEIQQDVFLKILEIIDQHGAECAYPTTTLHVPEGVMLQQAAEEMA